MKTVELLVNKPEFLKGSVITVDDKSAAVLIEKQEAKVYDPDAESAEAAEPPKAKRRRGRGNTAQTVNVVEADMPNTEEPLDSDTEADGEGGDHV
ncbi:hypothetical protein MSTE_03557 [Mycobacteroides stephanolepidis]|uniref:Uncharacterized protein n=1 Tax=[Mycobacterium] stephanolepidis TaxID=1520670 RepID=A0A1Z4F0Z7_9MYCO|nr:hypothetical protein [[Mycobacterium] stephanolepidis]BAX98857.1 hypothetical protein MSTE_03557 [[Mycobacterium] stephanolepidis]